VGVGDVDVLCVGRDGDCGAGCEVRVVVWDLDVWNWKGGNVRRREQGK